MVVEVKSDELKSFFGVERAGDGVDEGGDAWLGQIVLLDPIGDSGAGFFPIGEESFEGGVGVGGSGGIGYGVLFGAG